MNGKILINGILTLDGDLFPTLGVPFHSTPEARLMRRVARLAEPAVPFFEVKSDFLVEMRKTEEIEFNDKEMTDGLLEQDKVIIDSLTFDDTERK